MRFRKRIPIRAVGAFALAAILSMSAVLVAHADTADDLERAGRRLEELKDEIADREAAIAELQSQLNALAARIETASSEIQRTRQRIADVQARVKAGEREYAALRDQLSKRAAEAFMHGPGESLEFLLGAGSMSDLSDRIEYLDAVAQSDADLANDVQNKLYELESARADLEAMLAGQRSALDGLEQDRGMNPNDETRRQILRYFYDRNASATSRTGKKGSAVKISDVKRELKELHGLTQPQVMSNLTYLIDMGWVKTFDVEKQVGTKGGTLVPSSVTWYEIAAPGIDKIDGESEFTPPSRFAGVNISATGTNVITMGDGNVVNVDHRELHAELNTLRARLAASDKLTEADKLDIVADIESLKDQLAKPSPNPTVVKSLWSGIEKAAALAGLTELVLTVAPHVQQLLS